jgi:hypothetical protein
MSRKPQETSKISAAYDALLKQYPNTVCAGFDPFPFFFPLSVLSWLVLRLQLKFNISTTFWTLRTRLTRPKIYSKNSWELRRVWNFGLFIWPMWGTFELSFVKLRRLQLVVEFSDGIMLEALNEMMSESRMNLLWITLVRTRIVGRFGVITFSFSSRERCATYPVHFPSDLNKSLTGDNDMGRTTEDGCPP